MLGVSRGLEALLRRRSPDEPILHQAARQRLGELLGYDGNDPLTGARIRALALSTLLRQRAASTEQINLALVDPEAEVRRLAAGALADVTDTEWRSTLTDRAATDPDARVRLAALRTVARVAAQEGATACARLAEAIDDADPHVRLAAIDGLASCPGSSAILVRVLAQADDTWHAQAHALLALAALDPSAAGGPISVLAGAEPWQSRMYAARAAQQVGDEATLRLLVRDTHANVRVAALRGLADLPGHAADAEALAALESEDPQLVMAAARVLESSPRADEATPALLEALERFSAGRRETDRDVRMATLESIEEIGGGEQAERLIPYLRDFDPLVAERTARILTAWTGQEAIPEPQPMPRAPYPTLAQIEEMAAARATLRMAGGGEIVMRLLPWEAPTTTARFVELARAGSLDGLTFHRVAANFVIQGASPGANEFAGHGAYTRDEVTDRSHLRGTVGISTRGRDTGDGQIFVNLVDNVRLDHDYTIIAEVIDGFDAFDAVLEGAVIDAVIVEGGR